MRPGPPTPPEPSGHRDRDQGDEDHDPEAARHAADLLTRRWVLHVLTVLNRQPTRRNELRRAVDSLYRADDAAGRANGERAVHDTALTRVLRQMEIDGFIERTVLDHHHPPAVLYSITPEGSSLLPLARALADWHHQHGAVVAARRAAGNNDPEHGREVRG